jgi:tRNA A-37 threonylcarbamoyl transferase component Bud32
MDPTVPSKTAVQAQRIPGYRIDELIEVGGMGAVYLAEDENLLRRVAIKVIHPQFTDELEYQKRFAREALTVAAFQHSNIVTVYASGRVEGKQYIVMEYVSGGTLFHRISAGLMTKAVVADMGARMADALAYAHERDVIHRDFKPRNVLLRENGTPVLTDFGVAKSDSTQAAQTVIGIVIGSARYMAPEQASGQTITDRADVYSFGLVLYEMLTGALPEPRPVTTKEHERALEQHVGKEFANLIGRCLRFNPSVRPSAAECRDCLLALSAARRRWTLTHSNVVGAAAGVVIAIVASLAVRSAIVLKAQPSSSTSGGTVLTVQRLPASASVFVDANMLTTASTELAAGEHELVAVAPGYYGEVRHVTVANEGVRAISIALEATRLPTSAEERRFLKLTESRTLTAADLSGVSERTLGTVLQAQLLRQTGKTTQLDTLSQEVEKLRRAGDARAAVASLLIASVEAGRISRSQVTQSLIAASRGGDAMASLFLAVAYRESINASDSSVATTDPRFRSYCDGMALAAEQGWDEVASEYSRRDHCLD